MKEINFGQKVQFFREKIGMTQEQLAEQIGTSQNFISALERGKKFPSFGTLIKIIDALDVSADDLMEGVITNGYRIKENRLSSQLNNLSPEACRQILAVVETMIKNIEEMDR